MNIDRAGRLLHKFGFRVTYSFFAMSKLFVFVVEKNQTVVYACNASAGTVNSAVVRGLIRTHFTGIRSNDDLSSLGSEVWCDAPKLSYSSGIAGTRAAADGTSGGA